MKRLLLAPLFLLTVLGHAQNYTSSADIYLGLHKLNVVGSVLYIAAHPDDENTRLLTYLSREKQFRTGYLSLTRGDGGQNLIGNEQGIPLGLIRTQELLAARRIDGAEQFFTRAFDFGYSKTPEETFTKWDREKILADVVFVIRKFQPDVIITRFPTTGEGGHGHHTASAILANEAFKAAADPKRFPEQLAFVKPWQARRILWNIFGNNPPAGAAKLDVGGFNAVLGKSYGEIAAESRSQHKSQGFGVQRTRGEAMEYFMTTGGAPVTEDIFEGINSSWSRINGGDRVQKEVDSVLAQFNFMQPQLSVRGLIRLLQTLQTLEPSTWREQKISEVTTLVEQASGIWLETFTSQPFVAQGDSLKINFSINDRSGVGAVLTRVRLYSFDSSTKTTLSPNRNLNFSKTIKISNSTAITQPYWLLQAMEEGYFNIPEQSDVGQPDVTPTFVASFGVTIDGFPMRFTRELRYKFADQVKGEQSQPVTVVPALTVYGNPELVLLKKSETQPKTFLVQGVANRNLQSRSVKARAEGEKQKFMVGDTNLVMVKGEQRQYVLSVKPDDVGTAPIAARTSIALDSGKIYSAAMASIRYDHIPYINYFYDDWVKLVPIDLVTYNKKIGYITGAGDKVPEALEDMGYEVTLLTEKEISRNNLQQYDAIITGVRAFNTLDWIDKYYDRFMQYVSNGGNYIVQYSQANNIKGRMGPYPFVLSQRRITDEKAAVTFIDPSHPVLNFPNKINAADFNGWIQERSNYHAGNIDSNYKTIFRMNDPGEQPDDGSLIIAKYGKGYFTYTGLVFFRELPAGVPGAYRLMANIIALNRKNEF